MGKGEPLYALESAFFTKIGNIQAVHFDGLEFPGLFNEYQRWHLDDYFLGYAFILFRVVLFYVLIV